MGEESWVRLARHGPGPHPTAAARRAPRPRPRREGPRACDSGEGRRSSSQTPEPRQPPTRARADPFHAPAGRGHRRAERSGLHRARPRHGAGDRHGHELGDSDDRVLEALVVVGISSGALKLREDVIVAGGERLAIAAFRRLPELLLRHGGSRVLTRVLARFATTGTAKVAARVVPLGVGIGVGVGFDWVAVTGLGRAAMKYYGPGGPGARPLLLAPEDTSHVELGR